MNDLVRNEERDLTLLSDSELLQEFKSSLKLTAIHLRRMAEIWQILTQRGVDLSNLKKGLAEFIPFIAKGHLLPEAVIEYAGQKSLITHLSRLPLNTQQEILNTGTVQKLTILEDGKEIVADVRLDHLKAVDLMQIFSEHSLRTIDEQKELLVKRGTKVAKKKKYRTLRTVDVDKDKEFLIIGNNQIKIDVILGALSDIYSCDMYEFVAKHSVKVKNKEK